MPKTLTDKSERAVFDDASDEALGVSLVTLARDGVAYRALIRRAREDLQTQLDACQGARP